METKQIIMTPKVAAEILRTRNKVNRSVKPNWVATLAERMTKGEWHLIHQGIAFDETGELIDGQHRLMACVKSGVAIDILATYDEATFNFDDFDQGPKRTLSEITHLPKGTAKIYSAMLSLTAARAVNTQPSDVLKLDKSEIGIVARKLLKYCPTAAKTWSSAPMRAAAVISVLEGEDQDYVFGVYKSLATLHFANSPQVAEAGLRYAKTHIAERMNADTVFSLGMYVFDRRRKNSSRVTMVPEYTKNVLVILRQHVNNCIR